MSETTSTVQTVRLAADIVAVYVANNSVPILELPALLAAVHGTIVGLGSGQTVAKAEPQAPAVPVRKSVTAEHIVCLEDGKKFKSLKRHLRAKYDMSPEQYRAKWGLPHDYPMVSGNYAAERSRLAKENGLGSVTKTRSVA